jgi:membrane associated rhomboid family serine protease
MSIYNRDYMRDERRPRGGGPSTWSVVTWLLVANAAVFVLNNLLLRSAGSDLLGLSLSALGAFRLWTPLTYQFVHHTPWHLLMNGVGLFFIGRMLLLSIPPFQVLRLYVLGGLAGGALQMGWNALFGDALVIGASASVSALLFAVIALAPYRRVQFLLIPISLTLRQVAWICIALNFLTLFFGSPGTDKVSVAVMAHFGGMVFGWAFIRLGWHEGKRPARAKRPRSSFGIRILRDEEPAPPPQEPSPRRRKDTFVTGDIDAVLDKINEQGFQSLTAEERRILEKGSERLSDRLDRNS